MGAKEVAAGKVAAGAEWLDENFPGWERKIDLGTLALDNCQNCVCGQSLRGLVTNNIDSGYHAAIALGTGVAEDWTWNHDFERALQWAEDHGFAIEGDKELSEAFAELDALWTALIKERFSTGNLSDNV